jgi:hypothetical protein
VWSPHVSDLFTELDDFIQQSQVRYDNGEDDDDEQSLEEWLDDLGYMTTNIEQALAGKCEIMIDCDKYYAISYDHEDGIKRYLGL